MTGLSHLPRKQRTRQHVIADQSINRVERCIIDEGHVGERVPTDYGYDLYLTTFDKQGYIEPGKVKIQVKAAEQLTLSGTDYLFDLDIRDYRLWIIELMPVILVLFDASRKRGFWLHIQGYFAQRSSRQPRAGAKTVRVRVSMKQRMNRRAIARIRALKQDLFQRIRGVIHV
jgi:hypothetical protein